METARGDNSTSFDRARYHRAVVRPLRANPRRLPHDLRVRYDVHGQCSDQALARHLNEVTEYWSERSREHPDYSRAVYVALLKAHQHVLIDPAIRLGSAIWWSTYQPDEPDTAAEPAKPPLADADHDTATHRPAQALEKPSSEVTAEGDGTAPTVETPTTNPPTADALGTAPPTTERQLTDGALINKVHGLIARRIRDEIELSWIWPDWATTAIVFWGDNNRKIIDREEYRLTGRWQTTLSPELSYDRVEFSVAVRGPDPSRREWSEAVTTAAPRPCQEVTYKVRRLWHRFPSRVYKISFHANQPPAFCEIAIGFSGSDALPENVEACEKMGTVYLASDMSSPPVILPRQLGSGWLRCFIVNGESIILKHPDVRTLRIRSWPH